MEQNFTKTTMFMALLMLCFFCSIGVSSAQSSGSEDPEQKNLVKWNAGALLLNNFSFQYERAITRKISVAMGLRFAPKSGFAADSKLKDLIDNDETWENIKDFKTGNIAFTPEVRFYMGKGGFQGFYFAPFLRYARYSAEIPYQFDVDDNSEQGYYTETIPLDGNVATLTGGLLLGAQWTIGKRFALDWWILGPNYGTSSGNIKGTQSLNAEEQEALRNTLQDLEDLPVVKTKSTVDATGAKVDFNGPWAGLRAGLSIGFRF